MITLSCNLKKDRKLLSSRSFWLIFIAIDVFLLGTATNIEARNNFTIVSSPSIGDTLSPHNAADRFFDSGQEDLEKEIQSFEDPKVYLEGNLSEFSERSIEQIQEKEALDYLEDSSYLQNWSIDE